MDHERARALIQTHFSDGLANPLEQRAMRSHIRNCPQCKAYYDKMGEMEVALADGRAVPASLEERLGVVRPEPPYSDGAERSEKTSRPAIWIAAVVAIAAAILAVVFIPQQTPEYVGVRSGETEGRPAWFTAYVHRAGKVSVLKKQITAEDELLFSYSLSKRADVEFLAIAGLDANGRVHWYHPAYTSEDESPMSIRVPKRPGEVELKERVRAKHAPGRLEICALFTKKPLAIAELDPTIERTRKWPKVEVQDCIQVEVVP